MTPKEVALTEWNTSSESALRAELWLHGINPSEIISKQILMNMLTQIYFSDGK